MNNLLPFKVPVASQEPATPIIGYIERRAMYKAQAVNGMLASGSWWHLGSDKITEFASKLANKLLYEDIKFEEDCEKEKKNGYKK